MDLSDEEGYTMKFSPTGRRKSLMLLVIEMSGAEGPPCRAHRGTASSSV